MTWVVVGLIVAAVAVGALVLRRRRAPSSIGSSLGATGRIDAFAVSEPWRRHVQAAVSAQRRMQEVVRSTSAGPIRDRLADITKDVDTVVAQVWTIAQQGHQLAKADRRIDTGKTQQQLIELQHQLSAADDDTRAMLERSISSLESTQQTSQRLASQRDSAAAELRSMDTRLEELVARAAEISVVGVGADSIETLRIDMDALTTDLEALRLGMEETRRTATE